MQFMKIRELLYIQYAPQSLVHHHIILWCHESLDVFTEEAKDSPRPKETTRYR